MTCLFRPARPGEGIHTLPRMQHGDDGAGGMEEISRALFAAVDAAFRQWFGARLSTIAGTDDPRLAEAADEASAWVRAELRALLSTDPEQQRTNPLQLLRSAARFAVPVLRSLGAAVPARDEYEQRAMPDDPYAIGPLAWIDMGEAVHEAGITWGAWKAATVISRHRDG